MTSRVYQPLGPTWRLPKANSQSQTGFLVKGEKSYLAPIILHRNPLNFLIIKLDGKLKKESSREGSSSCFCEVAIYQSTRKEWNFQSFLQETGRESISTSEQQASSGRTDSQLEGEGEGKQKTHLAQIVV